MGNILTILSLILPTLAQDLVSITPKSSNILRACYTSNRVNNSDLSTAERTGSPVLHTLWLYVPEVSKEWTI